jgi:crotonobetainyl-CoA:carnitine CoA-transferase CaiB-like acyl-CoA transferase
MVELALSCVVVVDLSTGTDGPFCTKMLADLGARVIKVEPPGGDVSRRAGPFPGDVPHPEHSALFLYLNANKDGVTLDLSSVAGRQAIRELARKADVLVENHEPGRMSDYDLGYEQLAQLNPRLIYTSVTPCGQFGPYARYRAPDMVRQALAGWMVQGGLPDRPPLRSGVELSYYIGGVSAAAATLAALFYQRRTGLGQHVDVSVMEAFITCTGQEIHRTSDPAGRDQWFRRWGFRGLPFGIFPSKDGLICINLLYQAHWQEFCAWAGMGELLQDPRYATVEILRSPGRGEELYDRVSAWTRQFESLWLLEEGQKRRIATALLPTMAEAPQLPQHLAREFFREVPHPAGSYLQPGAPFRMSDSPWAIRKPAPRLGTAADWLPDVNAGG